MSTPGEQINQLNQVVNLTGVERIPVDQTNGTAYSTYYATPAQLGGIVPQTMAESTAGVTPTNCSYAPGSFYRYGAKGGAGRVGDAVAAGAVLTSVSGGFKAAQAGMVCVVVDGGATRLGGRPAPLVTTIASVQSATQVTLATSVLQSASITMTATLNGTATLTATSVNPITAGVGLKRFWSVSGANIPSYAIVASTTTTTLSLDVAATASATESITLSAPFEVCFGFDDSAALANALQLPYPITDVTDNFLTTQPLTIGGTGCNNLQIPSALLIFALPNNTYSCVTAAALDRGNVYYLAGARYLPFNVSIGEMECCNTGLDGFSLQPSNFSNVRARINNPFRNALVEWFATDYTWQEGNIVDISCAAVGLHFHHKVNKAAVYQNLGGYRIQGRACGLNSVYLGINATTQKDQLGGAIRIYAGGDTLADSGISQNNWGMTGASCELDGERTIALSYGSDICNSPITFVDATQSYVIEGAAGTSPSNYYYTNLFGAIVTEDITQQSDTRGGYTYYAMANTSVYQTTILSMGTGPWGQIYMNPHWVNGIGNLTNFGGGPVLNYAGTIGIQQQNNSADTPTLLSSTPLSPVINTLDNNVVTISSGSYTTLINGDYNQMFFLQDSSSGGGAIGFMTTDSTTITLAGTTLTSITFRRLPTVGLQAESGSGTRALRVMSFATGT